MKLGLGLGFNKGSGGGVPFSPADLTDLALWLDAADTSSIVHTANAVSQWNDKSGLGNNVTQGTGANQPATNTRTLNGRNTLDFDGNDFFQVPAGLLTINQAANTIFAVYANDGTAGGTMIQGKQVGFNNAIYNLYSDTADTRAGFLNGNFGQDTRVNYTASADAKVFAGRRRAAGANGVDVFLNGNIGSPLGTGAANSSLEFARIGIDRNGFNGIDGRLCEMIIYSRALTDTEMNQVGAYFSAKWGTPWTNLGETPIPQTISGLQLWLDASDTSTITHAANSVSQWNDKSGNAYHATQGTGAKQPVTGSTINSLNAIDFDGSNKNFSLPIAAVGGTQPALTIAAVYLPDTTTTSQMILSNNGTGGANTRTQVKNQEQDFGAVPLTRSSVTSGSALIHVARTPAAGSGLNSRMKINTDTQQTSGSYTRASTATSLLALGSYGDSGNSFFDGRIAEVIVYAGEKTDSEINQIGNYLSTKWGTPWTNL